MEDKDANSRLRYGLNVQCLANIFQNLDSGDLLTLGRMNSFYQQIVNDLVIARHEIDFTSIFERYIEIPEVFETYGKRIRKINFKHLSFTHSMGRLIRSINQHCGAGQLKSVKIFCRDLDVRVINLPIQFRCVERFEMRGNTRGQRIILSVRLSKSLRYLRLENINLDENFDWTELINIEILYLKDVRGINAQNFIQLLRHRPNIKIFHHDRDTFEFSTLSVCKEMADHCGHRIEDYSGEMPYRLADGRQPLQHLYKFVSRFTQIKKICLTSHQTCGVDLVKTLKQLAKTNTLEMLHIKYPELDCFDDPDVNCIFKDNPNDDRFDMMHFRHLKTLIVSRYYLQPYLHNPKEECEPLMLLTVYKHQILANVEHLTLGAQVYDFDFIKHAPQLRCVTFDGYQKYPIISVLEKLLRDRKNERTSDDFIELKMHGRNPIKVLGDAEETVKTP